MDFTIIKKDKRTSARCGIISTDRGEIETPSFMPVGTYGVVKTLTPEELSDAGVEIILGNTYHLYLRPGTEIIHNSGGLHKFISWNKPILTDSGGFQIFSLANLRNITDDGVFFKSTLDGSEHFITPEKSMEIQRLLGSDIIMALDECPPGDATVSHIEKAVNRTTQWIKRCYKYLADNQSLYGKTSVLFPIVQGGVVENLRKQSIEEVIPYAQLGIAIGGLAVGEGKSAMFETVNLMGEILPDTLARYLMGVGKPVDIVKTVASGIDMFDCVIPTRNARNGQLFTWNGKVNILNKRYKADFNPVDDQCSCYACRTFTRSYLRHLFKLNEIVALRMATLHNIYFYQSLMKKIRKEILRGNFKTWACNFMQLEEE